MSAVLRSESEVRDAIAWIIMNPMPEGPIQNAMIAAFATLRWFLHEDPENPPPWEAQTGVVK